MHKPPPAADASYTEQVPRFDELLSGIEVRQARQGRFARLGGSRRRRVQARGQVQARGRMTTEIREYASRPKARAFAAILMRRSLKR